MTTVAITRSTNDPEVYFLAVKDEAEEQVFSLGWQQLEALNRDVVKLRADDSIRSAAEDANAERYY